jgi:GntR family transcriptional regulator/MocR family aminotransferase
LHLIAEFEGITFTNELIDNIKKTGVVVHPVEEHAFIKGTHSKKIIIGYSHLNDQEIAEGVSRLKNVLAPLL